MGVEWEEADQELIKIAERLIDEHHPHLKDANIGFMYRDKAAKSGDMFIYGKAKKVSASDQVFLDFDFIIWIAKEDFERFTPEMREAIVDHELCHCSGTYGNWKMRHHDVQEFIEVVTRHGLWNSTLDYLNRAIDGAKQNPLFSDEPRGSVGSVPGNLLDRARENPEGVLMDLQEAAKKLREENGGEITVSLLQRRLRVGFQKAQQLKEFLEGVGA